MGIVALRQLEIMQTLQEALADKKQPRHREGWFYLKLPQGSQRVGGAPR